MFHWSLALRIWESAHSIHRTVEGVFSNVIGLIHFVNNWAGIFLIIMRGSCYLHYYKLVRGVGWVRYIYITRFLQKAPRVNTEPPAADVLLPVFFFFSLARSLQTLSHRSGGESAESRYRTPDADSRSEAGGVFHPTPVFFLFFFYIWLWYDK